MNKYRKKPIIIDALQWTGNNIKEIDNTFPKMKFRKLHNNCLQILTLEGEMLCCIGDWIVRGIKDEFYPVAHEIFELSYEKVSEHETP